MQQRRNASPQGALEVPALGRIIERDEVFEIPEHLAPLFEGQDETFPRVETAAERKARQKAEREAEASRLEAEAAGQAAKDAAATAGGHDQGEDAS